LKAKIRKQKNLKAKNRKQMEAVVSNIQQMHALAAAGPVFLATITMLTVVFIPEADFTTLLISFLARALLVRVVRLGRYASCGSFLLEGLPKLTMRLELAQIVLRPRQLRLYIDFFPDCTLRYTGRSLGYFTGRDVLANGLTSDREVVDFVQDRYIKVLAFLMARHERLGEESLVREIHETYSRSL
jgi:hypothetical protein